MRHYKLISMTILGIWLGIGVQLCGAEDATENAESPQKMSQKIMQGVNSFLQQERLEVVCINQMVVGMQGIRQAREQSMQVSIKRPYCLKVTPLNDSVETEICINKEEGMIFHQHSNQYWHGIVKNPLAELLTGESLLAKEISQLPAEFIIKGNLGLTLESLKTVTYLGSEQENGITVHQLRLESMSEDEPDAIVYVAEEDSYRPLRIKYDIEPMLEKMRQSPYAAQVPDYLSAELILNWRLNPEWNDDFFAVSKPSNAKQVIFFNAGEQEKHKLVGTMAPEYDLTLLDGSTKALSSYRDEAVVVLDFWSIRCPPCRAGLPILSKIAEEYRDKGVVFYAVNVEDSVTRIKEFFEELKINPSAATDRTGRGSQLFTVTGIPQTVIIDKKGKIQSVHQGFGEATPIQLRAELDALIAGIDIVSLGDTEAVEADLVCDSASLTAVSEGNETRQQLSWKLSNKGPGDVSAYSYIVIVLINGQAALLQSGATPIGAGETVTNTVPADEWNVSVGSEAKANIRVLVLPNATVDDTHEDNNMYELPPMSANK